MFINRLKKSSIALLSAALIIGSLLISSNVNASASVSTPTGTVSTSSYTQIDSGYSSYRTLAPGATESFKIFNFSPYARAYQLIVSSSASANYYPSSINISGQGRIHYLAQQPGLYVYDIILQPGAVANIDVSSASFPFTPNNYVISVY
ncbi:hypothetical protein PAECIP111893_02077 [Paenibacillus plantiphilus]|uniref:Uncharacterized protein n=1 Tax=Paenibacillus plantiphilus TaxID=2905650 RepID=A0ABN8GF63_9BACL|nr:hypothetical protein [Paenibacillus plantiphilus]CAH1203810.1 hypothetical protein PAECIP111893_02077 [Paenibacillus plantiphilus]